MGILAKYMVLKKLGASYTWENLDEEKFLNIQYMNLCMDGEARKAELDRKRSEANSSLGGKVKSFFGKGP